MDQQWQKDIHSPDPEVRRRTIIVLAESGEMRALDLLKWVYENDADPALRNLARTAGQHLWQKIKGDKALKDLSKSSKGRTPAPAQESVEEREGKETPAPAQESAEEEEGEEPPAREGSPEEREAARTLFERALSLHLNDNTEKAIVTFSKALRRNPNLCSEDDVAANLAKELTGLPVQSAVQALLDEERRDAFISEVQTEGKSRAIKLPITLILLMIAFLTLFGVSFYFIRTGALNRYQTWFTVNYAGRHRKNVGGLVYYLVPPRGRKPARGWPLVVGLHGYEGEGQDMLSIANQFTNQGIVYIAPTFGKYAPNPGTGPLDPMVRILEDVDTQYPVDRDRVVLLGYSQGGTFAYSFSIFHPEWVSGVVTAGAPELVDREPPTNDTPYVFTWGAKDGLQDFVIPGSVDPLINRGFNVTYHIVEGAGHEVTPFAVEQVLQLISE